MIENTEQSISNTWPLPSFSIASFLQGLGMDNTGLLGLTELRMNLDTDDDMEMFMRDLGVRIADFDSLIFDTE
jgi:hypothetical protein